MQRVNAAVRQGLEPARRPTRRQLRAALARKQSLLDFRLQDIADAKRALGMDSEHARKLDGLVDGWREVESAAKRRARGARGGATPRRAPRPARRARARPATANNELNCDQLSPVHDQMIALIKLAFEWDLTRVVAFTLSGASSGQRWPSQRRRPGAPHARAQQRRRRARTSWARTTPRSSRALLGALKGIDDGDGQTALYNSSVILGMECWSDSSSGHYLNDIPFILAGQGGGAFQTGRIVDAGGRNNNDLLVSVQNASGIPSTTFGLASLCKGPIV